MTFQQLITKFPTENSIIEHYLSIRYPNGLQCNHCQSTKVYTRKNHPKLLDCYNCKNSFSPFKNTIFEKSSTDLRKWFYAIHLLINAKKGISAKQLEREIGVTYKTAWRMLQQIRIAMGNTENQEFFDTIVEVDETYIGGKPRKQNNHGKDDKNDKNGGNTNKRGRGTSKTPVVGVIDRINKKAFVKVALPNKNNQKLTAIQLISILKTVSKQENNNIIITDEFKSYNSLTRNKFIHLRIDHGNLFSDRKGTHTNNIESFWSTLKRGVYGIYHHISTKYMQRYIDEFCFRYNNRKNDMFGLVLKQSVLV